MSGIDAGDLAQAVSVFAAGVTLSANTIVSGDNIDVPGFQETPYAISIEQDAALIVGNTITAGRAESAYPVVGVKGTSAGMTISGNVIHVEAGLGSSAFGIDIMSSVKSGGPVIITDNVVAVGDAQQQSTGLSVINGDNPTIISNNDFFSGNASTSSAAIDDGTESSYENNIMFTTGNSAARICFNARPPRNLPLFSATTYSSVPSSRWSAAISIRAAPFS